MSLWSINIQQTGQKHKKEKKIASSTNGVGRSGQYMQNNETTPPTYTTHKNKLKIDKRLKYMTRCHKSPRGECKLEKSQIFHGAIFSPICPLEQGT